MADFSGPRHRVLSGAGRNRTHDRLCRVLRANASHQPRPLPARFCADLRCRRAARSGDLYRALREADRRDDPGESGRLDLGTPALESLAPGRTIGAKSSAKLTESGRAVAVRQPLAASGLRHAGAHAIPPAMKAVPHLMHVGVELMSRFARAIGHAPPELGRTLPDGVAEMAGVV